MKKNLISIHFDGPIARDHAIQLRTFAKTLGHIQTAIDRAFLDIKYGSIWKYARLSEDDYEQTDFLLQQTREGGFIADLIGSDESNKDTITRINNAVAPAYEQSNSSQPIEQEAISDQLDSRKRNYNAGVQEPVSYETLIHNPDPAQTRAYGDRSIVKEFDQIASAIRGLYIILCKRTIGRKLSPCPEPQ
ncbi:hypothetical protein C798_05435 [Herbaspirillum rubrisubalbicans Os34]|uniref:Uncharacterized protein n=1 Tax=Herbaspirillum rubrisubalbicans Os34 TaxID=1235827 RepID=A0A6M3ZM94_9BURK|nr:hypothetical protein [Herbaspirillum rubrisubalbicans]QJP99686.1 hypothetical protein C798_05435 [Herbaspirillum rubrisubalbicans Os34]